MVRVAHEYLDKVSAVGDWGRVSGKSGIRSGCLVDLRLRLGKTGVIGSSLVIGTATLCYIIIYELVNGSRGALTNV